MHTALKHKAVRIIKELKITIIILIPKLYKNESYKSRVPLHIEAQPLRCAS